MKAMTTPIKPRMAHRIIVGLNRVWVTGIRPISSSREWPGVFTSSGAVSVREIG